MATAQPMPPKGPCDATIAICTYNRLHTLPRTLQSLKMLRGPYSFEIIVVNGPSDDGTTEFLDTCEGLRSFSNPEANLSISRNIAIANAAGKYIAFIDDDAIPEPDWLTRVIDALEADQELAAVGGFIRDANGIGFQAQYTFCDVFGESYPCDNPDYATFLAREKRLYSSLTGTNVTFRKSALEEVSGFDEVFAYYLDETDVNKRMDDKGMRAMVVPDAEIHHKYAPSHLRTETNVPRDMFPIARSIGYFAMRHAAPELGWEAVGQHLKAYYRSEFSWKSQMVATGSIDREKMALLMHQVRRGLMAGIDAHFDPTSPDALPAERVAKHHVPDSAPAVHRMRAPEDNLRLCMFSRDHAHPDHGGIGRWSNLVAKGLAERGNEITLIGELHRTAQHQYCDYTAEGYWSHNISFHGREAGNEVDCLGLPEDLANMSKRKRSEMRRVMGRRDFQVASTPIWDMEGAAVIGEGDLPTVLSLHTCAGIMLESKPEWRENEAFFNNHVLRSINAEIQGLRRADMILANSEAIMRDISALYQVDLFDRPHVIVPHGIADIEAPEGLLETRQAVRTDTDGPLRVLFLGRLETRKGIGHLVPVMQKILERHDHVVLDLVGDRVDDANMALVQGFLDAWPGRVVWHGFLDEDALDHLMRQTDIFLAPSLYESFGLIYVEAQRYSLPSVAYAAGGVPEVVTDGTDGLLAPLEDQQALYQAMERLITDAPLRTRLSQAARTSFETKFHYGLMAERLEEVYRNAARSA